MNFDECKFRFKTSQAFHGIINTKPIIEYMMEV